MPVEKALGDSKLVKHQIHKILVTGGSTHIPKIQQELKDFFNRKLLNKTFSSEEAVVYGAAINAVILENAIQDLLLLDTRHAAVPGTWDSWRDDDVINQAKYNCTNKTNSKVYHLRWQPKRC